MVIPAALLGVIWLAMVVVGWVMLLRGIFVLGRYLKRDAPDMRSARDLAWGLALVFVILAIPALVLLSDMGFYYTLASPWLYAVVTGIALVIATTIFWIVTVRQQVRHCVG